MSRETRNDFEQVIDAMHKLLDRPSCERALYISRKNFDFTLAAGAVKKYGGQWRTVREGWLVIIIEPQDEIRIIEPET